jgi:hypothetical protein
MSANLAAVPASALPARPGGEPECEMQPLDRRRPGAENSPHARVHKVTRDSNLYTGMDGPEMRMPVIPSRHRKRWQPGRAAAPSPHPGPRPYARPVERKMPKR